MRRLDGGGGGGGGSGDGDGDSDGASGHSVGDDSARGYRDGGGGGIEPLPRVPLTVIDFEYSCYGPRGFDLANHFVEYAGFDCDWSLLPGRGVIENKHSTDVESTNRVRTSV